MNFLKPESSFKLKELMGVNQFDMNETNNQSSTNYSFDFNIEGELKYLLESDVEGTLSIRDFPDLKANATLKKIENQRSNLNIKLNIENYKNQTSFTFKDTMVGDIYLDGIEKIYLLNLAEDENIIIRQKKKRWIK